MRLIYWTAGATAVVGIAIAATGNASRHIASLTSPARSQVQEHPGRWYWIFGGDRTQYFVDRDSIAGPIQDRRIRLAAYHHPPLLGHTPLTIQLDAFDCTARTVRTRHFEAYLVDGTPVTGEPPEDMDEVEPVEHFTIQAAEMEMACDQDEGGKVEIDRSLVDAARLIFLLRPLVRNPAHASILASMTAAHVRRLTDTDLSDLVEPRRIAEVRDLLER
jgi:hypothetical protein